MLKLNGTDPVTLLRAAMAARSKTRGDMSEKLDISQQTIGKWMGGKTSMPFEKIVEGAEFLGFDVRIEFVERTDN
tara:strand:+ start:275 stop:499 length:225 start_codon:yes stop_codon:yes gene_type:complete